MSFYVMEVADYKGLLLVDMDLNGGVKDVFRIMLALFF
jgi:hypothetical protein